MASGTLSIKIKIDQEGSVKNLVGDFKDLRKVLKESSVFQGFDSVAKNISASLDGIKKDIGEITGNIDKSIKSISTNAKDIADNSFSRGANEATARVETLAARVAILGAGVAFLGSNWDAFLASAISGSSALAPVFSQITGTLTSAGNVISNVILTNVNLITSGVFNISLALQTALDSTIPLSSAFLSLGRGVTSIGLGISSSLISVVAAKFFLGEINILVGRILGRGQENLNVLTRATRLIGLFDDSLNRSFNTIAAFSRVGFFSGISLFVNPILGLPGVLNSTVDLVSTLLRKSTTGIKGLFGDGRAQVTLILDDLRTIARRILPSILKIADSFAFILRGVSQDQLDSIIAKLFGVEKRARTLKNQASDIINIIATASPLFGGIFRIVEGIGAATRGIGKALFKSVEGIGALASGAGRFVKSIFTRKKEKVVDKKPIEEANQKTLDFADSAKKVEQNFSTTRKQVKLILDLLFEVGKTSKGLEGSLFFGAGKSTAIQNFVGALVGFSEGTKSFEALNKSAKKFFEVISEIAIVTKTQPKGFDDFIKNLTKDLDKGLLQAPKNLGKFRDELKRALLSLSKDDNLASEAAQKLGNSFTKSLSGAFKEGIDVKKFKEASKSIVNAIGELIPGPDFISKKIKIDKAGEKIPAQLSDGIKKGMGKTSEASEKLAQDIALYFPMSPAKKGLLKNLVRSGSQIPKQLADGMRKNINAVATSANRLAEMIANYFPRSLPRLGPLRGLITAGVQIPQLIGQGIKKGTGFAISEIQNLTGNISERINKIAELGELAKRANISTELVAPLQNVLEQFGASANEISLPFNKINEAIQGSNKEAVKRLKSIGIEVEALKDSADAPLQVFLKVADIIATTEQGSIQSKKALEALGLSASSGLVKVLQQGSTEIQKLLNESAKLGISLDQSFVNASIAFRSLRVQLQGFASSTIDRFLGGIVPQINELGKSISLFLQEKSQKIQGLIQTISNVVGKSIALVTSFVKLAVDEPNKAIKIASSAFSGFFDFIVDLFQIFTGIFTEKVNGFLSDTGNFIFIFVKNLVSDVLKDALNVAVLGLTKLGFSILSFLNDFVGNSVPAFFISIKNIAAIEVGKLAIFIIKKFRDSIKSIPGVEFLAEKFGFDGLINISDKQLDGVVAIVESQTGSIGKNLNELLSGITGDIDKATSNLSDSVGNLIEKTTNQLDELKNSAKEAGSEIANQGVIDKAKESLDVFIGKLKDSFAGTELQTKFQELLDSFKLDNVQSIEDAKLKLSELSESLDEFNKKKKDTFDIGKVANEFLQKQGAMIQSTLRILSNSFEDLARLGKGNIKALFAASKALAIAEANINIARAVSNALAAPTPLAAAEGAAKAAAATIQLAKIVATTLGFADGGLITQGTGPRSDDVLIRASKREFIQPADATDHYGVEFMELVRRKLIPKDAIRNLTGNLPRVTPRSPSQSNFRNGGSTNNAVSAAPKNETVIANFIDPELFGQFMSSNQGKRIIFNTLRNNPGELRSVLRQD